MSNRMNTIGEEVPLPGQGPILIVVTQDSAFKKQVTPYMANQGYDVHVAKDEDTTLTILECFRPDAVMLDLYLGRNRCLNVLKTLRTQAFSGTLIMLSGFSVMPLVIDIRAAT